MILKLCSTWKTQATDSGKFVKSLGTEKADIIKPLYNAHLGEVKRLSGQCEEVAIFNLSFDCTVMA